MATTNPILSIGYEIGRLPWAPRLNVERNNGVILDFRAAAALIFGGGRAAGSININSSPLPTKKVRYEFHH